MSNDTVLSVINEDLQKRVGLSKRYPFYIADRQLGCTAYADIVAGFVVMDRIIESYHIKRIEAVYLHEVAHLIARAKSIDHDPESYTHNRYFACLEAVIYRRAGLLDRLSVYDFGDGKRNERQGALGEFNTLPEDGELICRFAYILRRSAELASLPLTIEQIADKIYREDVYPAWVNPPKKIERKKGHPVFMSLLLGLVIGSACTSVLAVTTSAFLNIHF